MNASFINTFSGVGTALGLGFVKLNGFGSNSDTYVQQQSYVAHVKQKEG